MSLEIPEIKTWTTQSGKTLSLQEMNSRHIENCITLIERKMSEVTDDPSKAWDFLCTLNGEMALAAAEKMGDPTETAEEEAKTCLLLGHRYVNAFQAELERRFG